MNLLPYAYYSEIVQAGVAFLGFAFGIWAVWDARKDERFWNDVLHQQEKLGRTADDDTKTYYAMSKVATASELATVVAYVGFIVIGVSGMFLAPPDLFAHADHQELLGITISRYGMVCITAVLTFKSVIRRRGRLEYYQVRRRKTDGGAHSVRIDNNATR
jgi:hypothetical protein